MWRLLVVGLRKLYFHSVTNIRKSLTLPVGNITITYNVILHRAAKLVLEALYMLRQICPPVCLSVCQTPVLCQNKGTQRNAVFTVG